MFSLPNQILHINSLLQAKLIIYNNLEKNSQNITIVVNAIYNARGPTSVLSQNFAYRETYEQFCNAIQSLLNYWKKISKVTNQCIHLTCGERIVYGINPSGVVHYIISNNFFQKSIKANRERIQSHFRLYFGLITILLSIYDWIMLNYSQVKKLTTGTCTEILQENRILWMVNSNKRKWDKTPMRLGKSEGTTL